MLSGGRKKCRPVHTIRAVIIRSLKIVQHGTYVFIGMFNFLSWHYFGLGGSSTLAFMVSGSVYSPIG